MPVEEPQAPAYGECWHPAAAAAAAGAGRVSLGCEVPEEGLWAARRASMGPMRVPSMSPMSRGTDATSALPSPARDARQRARKARARPGGSAHAAALGDLASRFTMRVNFSPMPFPGARTPAGTSKRANLFRAPSDPRHDALSDINSMVNRRPGEGAADGGEEELAAGLPGPRWLSRAGASFGRRPRAPSGPGPAAAPRRARRPSRLPRRSAVTSPPHTGAASLSALVRARAPARRALAPRARARSGRGPGRTRARRPW